MDDKCACPPEGFCGAGSRCKDAPPAAQPVARHVGDTGFEGWMSCHEPDRSHDRVMRYSKQDMRKAYWAGYQERAAAPQAAQPTDIEDPVIVPRGLLGAACYAIERKADAPQTLAAIRAIAMSAPSQAAPQAAQPLLCDRCRCTLAQDDDKGLSRWFASRPVEPKP